MTTPNARVVLLACILTVTMLGVIGAMAQAPAVQIKAVVIVHPSNPVKSLTRTEAGNLFMKRSRTWPDGSPVVPIDQPLNPLRRAFSLAVLGREADAVSSYWLQQVYSGREARPEQMVDDAAVLAYVAANPGAIGYISATTPATGVKVVPIQKD